MITRRPTIDGAGRTISYARVSITDRCDLRCTYCLPERPVFLPKQELLSLDELDRICSMLVRNGVRRLRITGGEPLVRRNAIDFISGLSRHLITGALDEVTLTTNATQLSQHAEALARAGVRRINVSLDSLDPETFKRITRSYSLSAVLEGISAARAAGISVRLNTVVLQRDNRTELPDIIRFAHDRSMTACLIETMPMGNVGERRSAQFVSLSDVRRDLEQYWHMQDVVHNPGAGPARYVRIQETGGLLGFITPISQNFCSTCNRVRVTSTGRMYLCLGQAANVDFRDPLRSGISDQELDQVYRTALQRKPAAHDFSMADNAPSGPRFMAVTGG